jgi:Putative transposase
MQPLELLEKIAAIIPRPKIHLTRFHGIFAPNDKHRKLVVPQPPPVAEVNPEDSGESLSKARITWARLLKRVFDIDVETCAECGGKTKIIAAIEDPPVIRKILEYLGLPAKAPVIHAAKPRGPPAGPFPDDNFSQTPSFDFD